MSLYFYIIFGSLVIIFDLTKEPWAQYLWFTILFIDITVSACLIKFGKYICRNCGEKGHIGWMSTKKYNEKIKEGFKNLKNRRKVENPRPLKKWEPGDKEPWPRAFDSEIYMGEDHWDSGLEDNE